MFREMRRKDRAIGNKEAAAILESGEYGILSTTEAAAMHMECP